MIEYNVTNDICTLRLNTPPVNTFTFGLLAQLQSAVRRANDDGNVRAIVLIGDEKHFSAGADVNIFEKITSAAEAIEISRTFQDAFGAVEDSAKPVVAAVAGKVMGSALEVASACHFRACTPNAMFSMPEVRLGINPGAGGTQRLPRLIGPAAIRMLLTAETINAEQALQLGLVDAISQDSDLIATARKLLDAHPQPVKTSTRTHKISDSDAYNAAIVWAEKFIGRGRPEIIAPRKILEAVKTGIDESFQAGLAAEQRGFAECMGTLATRNKIYVFLATRKTTKAPGLADEKPATIKNTAVVGMGSMGTGIAHAMIIAGLPVVVFDRDRAILEKGLAQITGSVEKRVAAGKLSSARAKQMLTLIRAATDPHDIAQADLVIEAVFEDIPTKQAVIAEIEKACSAQAIIASNTSTLSLDTLAENMKHPDRLVGLHFFNPAQRMPLVEVIKRDSTPASTIATALNFAKRIRKTPVLVANSTGFLVNRIFIPYFKEAFYLLEDGADARAIDAAAVDFGFPMGPLTLIDMAGLDILVFTDEVMHSAFPRHGSLSAIATKLVEKGCLGQKTGSGLYKYQKGDYTRHDNPDAQSIIAGARSKRDITQDRVDHEEIIDRLVLRMVNEALYVMNEQIVRRQSDVDAAMVLGTGFPDFRGGVLKYANDLGIETVINRLEALAKKHGERFQPPRQGPNRM
ncbi:MAG: enoyl-CoA hydratase/isomerase family protein [Planctomycetes bacterium]|nr:enoyl-CoA hydratase/isomerase family protein [Planctomycetota bacterium]